MKLTGGSGARRPGTLSRQRAHSSTRLASSLALLPGSESTDEACAIEADRLAGSAGKGAVREALVRARGQLDEEATRARQEGTAAVLARRR